MVKILIFLNVYKKRRRFAQTGSEQELQWKVVTTDFPDMFSAYVFQGTDFVLLDSVLSVIFSFLPSAKQV